MNETKQQALLAIESLKARVLELEEAARAAAEPIAIIGYACRLPGAPDAETFWKLLEEGREATSEIPAERWDVDAFYDADPDAPGKMATRRAGFIDDVAGFDASFFGVSPREAAFMDPQHRLLLETAWLALEHSALPPGDLAGTRTGVFMGLSTHEYLGLLAAHLTYEAIDIYSGTGTSPAAAVGRISYRLGLEGPAVTIDTACSSSLVGIHQACQALRAGECDLALAGGVNVILNPTPMINFSKARMLAPDGRCKTFDAAADGYVRGEGCGAVVLKRLGDALRDGDHIRAVVRGSAVNQDGASGGLTVPNGRAQQRVIQEALKQAHLKPRDIDYLEAHGTGTSLGDPIEIQAAGAAYGQGREEPLLVGSVKTNIGHLEAAAGIASVIKVVMSLEQELLPKHLHFTTPSPYIPWERLPVEIVRDARPWQRNGRPRLAGVSSFGFSGTNAHVVLEEAPAFDALSEQDRPSRRYQMLPVSARSPEALRKLISNYLAWLEAHPDASLEDLCYTAGVGRSHLEHRMAFLVDSRERLRRVLTAHLDDQPAPGAVAGLATEPPKTAWLFTGQGSQYSGMAAQLFETQPVFRETLEHCAEVLRDELDEPLLDVIFGDSGKVSHTSYAQPAIFAVEMGLARLWQSWGLEPDVLLGHSVGQYAAACLAGVFSLEDGLMLLAKRGKLMGCLPEGGAMAAIFADSAKVEQAIESYPSLSIAAYNGANTVISGPAADVDAVMTQLQATDVRCDRLDTSHAFHSGLLEPMLDEFESFAAGFSFQPLRRMLVCNRTGQVLSSQSVLDAQYWRRHARQPVQFAESVKTLSDLGCKVLLEVGPQPVLTAMAMRAWPEEAALPKAVASLRKDLPDNRQVFEALSHLYAAGARIDFKSVDSHLPRRKVEVPAYPFQHKPYWFTPTRDPFSFLSGSTVPPQSWDDEEAVSVVAGADDWLLTTPPENRETRIGELLTAELATALGVSRDEVDPDALFVSLGMDSLMATELRSRLQSAFNMTLPAATLIYNYPNITSLKGGLLQLWTKAREGDETEALHIKPLADGVEAPLSHAQEQLWFLHQLFPSSSAYNVAVKIRIQGALDIRLVEDAFNQIIARHEVLRTSFHSELGVPKLDVAAALSISVPVESAATQEEAPELARREAETPFDLETAPLLRVKLIRVTETDHTLVLTMHHLATDGWSYRLLMREFAELYSASTQGREASLPELTVQYSDYAAFQREQLTGQHFDAMLDFWKNELGGVTGLELPTDRPRSPVFSFRGKRRRFELGAERAAAIRKLCSEANVTSFVPLLTAFAAVLQRYSGQDDFVVGTLSANRNHAEVENLIGFFVNALPLRVRLDGEPTVAQVMDRVRNSMLAAVAHEDVPFDLVVNAVERERDASRNALFQVQFVLQPGISSAEFEGLQIEAAEIDLLSAKRDLTLTIFDDDEFRGHVEYATDLYDAERIERFLKHLEICIDAMTGNAQRPLSQLPILTAPEVALHQKRTLVSTSGVSTVNALFARTVERSPDACAIRGDNQSLTYRELDEASNRVARMLRKKGLVPGDAVGVSLPRSAAMVTAFLGVLKAGGVYVPVDPSYPAARIRQILEESGIVLQLDSIDSSETAMESAEALDDQNAGSDTAYIIYTSGSTGRPKGVRVSHAGVAEYAETLCTELGITSHDVYLHTASSSFSSSIRQLVLPLCAGATIVIASNEERADSAALLLRIREAGVTVVDLVPSVVRQLVETVAGLDEGDRGRLLDNNLRLVLTASEPLRYGVVQNWRTLADESANWVNMYGQTETTGIVSLYLVPADIAGEPGNAIVPIGRPRANVTMTVLDQHGRPLPAGVPGELYICGAALAQSYVGDPHPVTGNHTSIDGEPLYATGDMVRMRFDGTLEFLGRTDQQLKIRGLRIEPREVEAVLLEYPEIREIVVMRAGDGDDAEWLVAYYTASGEVSPSLLRAHARKKLPDYMVPSMFIAVERMPLTANGKIDLGALPKPDSIRREEAEFIAPAAGLEEDIAAIWRDLLRQERVSAGDNFFILGGHSLLAAQVRSRIHHDLGVDLPLTAIFEHQTLQELAARVSLTERVTSQAEVAPLVPVARLPLMPVSLEQELIWYFEQNEPNSAGNWIEVGMRIRGQLDIPLLLESIQKTVDRHEVLRTIFRQERNSLWQVILPEYKLDVAVRDEESPNARPPLDLASQPPVRMEVIRCGENDYALNLSLHRLIADGAATQLLLTEIGGLYLNGVTGAAYFPPMDTTLQYADYAAWERTTLKEAALSERADAIADRLSIARHAFQLPSDKPRDLRKRRGARVRFDVPANVTSGLRATATRERASLYATLLMAFATALGDYSGNDQVFIGAAASRRNLRGTEQIIGPFMNTIPLLLSTAKGSRVVDRIRATNDVLVEGLSVQEVPLHYILSRLEAAHGEDANGIAEVSLVMEDPEPRELTVENLTLSRVDREGLTARREITLTMSDDAGDLSGTLIFDSDLYEQSTMTSLVAEFQAALAAIAAVDDKS